MKKTYISPAVEQEAVVLEAGIAVSGASIVITDGESETMLEDWEKGNENWW